MSPIRTQADRHLQKETRVLEFLAEKKDGHFLEIGIGQLARRSRFDLVVANGMTYTGCDFASVVEEHKKAIRKMGFGEHLENGRINFVSNVAGNYNYSLLKLKRTGARFDVIYLDGHHTFDMDLPAAILATAMLNPGGYFALDDIHWTLAKVARLMHDNFTTWLFYKDMYDFTAYAPEQIREPGIKAIVEDVLIPDFGFMPVDHLSGPGWAVLRKGEGGRSGVRESGAYVWNQRS